MIELFSRRTDSLNDPPEVIIPIHIDDETSSLSAILLNDDFYNFMLEGRKVISGVSVLDAEHLIPFKMYAWLDYKDKKASGEHVNERDLKKHKYDVFRLLQIVDPESKINTSGLVKECINRFREEVRSERIPLAQLGLSFDLEWALDFLDSMYG